MSKSNPKWWGFSEIFALKINIKFHVLLSTKMGDIVKDPMKSIPFLPKIVPGVGWGRVGWDGGGVGHARGGVGVGWGGVGWGGVRSCKGGVGWGGSCKGGVGWGGSCKGRVG